MCVMTFLRWLVGNVDGTDAFGLLFGKRQARLRGFFHNSAGKVSKSGLL